MTRNIFGWSYPPGAAGDPNAPWNQVDPPCAICGRVVGDCICLTCSCCEGVGDPVCYAQHGLVRSAFQIASLAEAEARRQAEADTMSAAYGGSDEDADSLGDWHGRNE
jgi:hypothetical protein